MYNRQRYNTGTYNTTATQQRLFLENLLAFVDPVLDVNVYPFHLPQRAVFPCVSYWLVSRIPLHHLKGSAGVTAARVQFDVWSRRYSDAMTIVEQLRQRLDGYRGFMGTTRVQKSHYKDRKTFYEQPASGSDEGLHHIAVDYLFQYPYRKPVFAFVRGDTLAGSTVEQALLAKLRQHSRVTAPIYLLKTPQKHDRNLPAIVYSITDEDHLHHLTSAAGWVNTNFNLVFRGRRLRDVERLAENARLALDGYRGGIADRLIGGILLQSESGTYEQPSDGSDDGIFEITADYLVMTKELIPGS